ncbi:type IV toxin-antitoxin system AbiEi family antitoxin domain-containing protein [Eubacterium oxidoreducens]|uniref:Transcriptional regulator, AbiEi antitoxin, Type IV TA system n=1 Tax=Eubacterium oxidoreducens TaxID=1732 RepID=A0A1G5ZZJ8_EUBOX|nr:type IV toxin-antitoxin system AbiEi family antitoxin domain-containing protein [Eubacterium oxidoreducens]SDB01634.1 Transcriptional regulator, AbiEi antitoxin, Type IV TA system [Eubacterium oxidoreducens]
MAENKIRRALNEKLEQSRQQGKVILKSQELYEMGFSTRMLHSYVEEDILMRVKSGIYCLSKERPEEEDMICELFPDGVLCMESALYEYGYLRQRPLKWQIAIDKDTSKARFKMDYPQVKPYYTEAKVLSIGVTEIALGKGTMKIYDKERLIVDCIRYENQLEHEILKNALRHYLDEPNQNIKNLLKYATERKVISKVRAMIGVWL